VNQFGLGSEYSAWKIIEKESSEAKAMVEAPTGT
jgi:hypothetical protein